MSNMVHLVHKHKLSLLCRASAFGSPAANASEAIMDRSIRQLGLFDTSGESIEFDSQYTYSWFGSILQLNTNLQQHFNRKPDADKLDSILSLCPLQRRDWCSDLLVRHEATDDLTVPSTGFYP